MKKFLLITILLFSTIVVKAQFPCCSYHSKFTVITDIGQRNEDIHSKECATISSYNSKIIFINFNMGECRYKWIFHKLNQEYWESPNWVCESKSRNIYKKVYWTILYDPKLNKLELINHSKNLKIIFE